MASSGPRARKVESVAARSAIQHCGWPSHPAINSAINESIEYLVTSGSVLPQSVSFMQIRRPSQEEVMAAIQWVDE